MKHVIAMIALLVGACATETQDITPNTVEVAGAKSEPILAACHDTSCVCKLPQFQQMRHTLDINYGCTSTAWNPSNGTYSIQNTTCKYGGYKSTMRIDGCFGVGSAQLDSRFRISKTVGSDPRFNPWLVGTCYGAATCITQ